jgi:hypothetical protein
MGLKIRNAVTSEKMRILKNKDHIRNQRDQIDLKSGIALNFAAKNYFHKLHVFKWA